MAANPILLLLRLPPPYGGGEVLSALLKSRLEGVPGYVVCQMCNRQGSKSNQGRLTWTNIRFAWARIQAGRVALREHRPAAVYLLLPLSFAAFLWAAVMVIAASRAGARVCGDVPGMRFLFFDSRWKRAVGVAVLRRLASIRFLGDGIRRSHAGYGFRHLVVFPNGVEAPPAEPRGKDFARRRPVNLLYVGSLEASKGVDVILDAAVEARKLDMPVRWTLMGEWVSNAFREWAMERIRSGGLDDAVKVVGLVVGDARWHHYREAHILVHPTRFDAQPLTILEAMSQGLAVISTRVGAIPETIADGRNGTLLDSATPAALLAAVRRLMKDPDQLLQVMHANREDYLARYTADSFVRSVRLWLESVRDEREDSAGRPIQTPS